MLNFILRNLESFPAASFTEAELVRISRSSFDMLTKQKCLSRVEYDYMKDPYYSSALADSGNERFIKKRDGRFYAYSSESPDIAPIEIKKAGQVCRVKRPLQRRQSPHRSYPIHQDRGHRIKLDFE